MAPPPASALISVELCAADQLHGGAAVLVAAGAVGRQHDLHVVGRRDQQLRPEGAEVLVVVAILAARPGAGLHRHPAIAVAVRGIHAQRRVVAQRGVERAGQPQRGVVAEGDFAVGGALEARLAGDHVDDAGRGVLAEQGALRPLQHLDALQLAEVAEADAVARAVDAVDHHADRGFQADVVAHRADAADARGGDGLALGAGDGQARHQDLQVLDVAHAGVLQGLLGQGGDRDRHVLHDFFALLRGDDQGVEGLGFLLRRRRGVLREGRQGKGGDQAGDDGRGQRTTLWLLAKH